VGVFSLIIGLSINKVHTVTSKIDFTNALKAFTPIRQNMVLWGILAMTAVYGVEAGNRDSITQIFVKDFLGNGEQFAMTYLQLGVAISGVLGSVVYLNFLKDISPKIMIVSSLITVGLVQYVCAFYVYNLESFYFLFSLQCFSLGWFYPLCDLLLYDSVNEKYKATALSMQNMADGFMQGVTCLLISRFLINNLEINKIWLIGSASAFFCIIVLNIFLIPETNVQVQEETK
jgi:MFS family permease